MRIAGGCLCGKIRYGAEADPVRVVVCHCKNCQKQSGTAFSVVVAIPAAALRLEGATVDYVDVGDSGSEVVRRFCGSCGSPLVSEVHAKPDVIFIKAGTLDDTSWLAPQAHIWCRSAQAWTQTEIDLPRYAGPLGIAPA